VKEIEAASGGAKISINQETKALGYSIAAISGTPEQQQVAFDQMGAKLSRVNPAGDGLVPVQMGGQPPPSTIVPVTRAEGISQQIAASLARAGVTTTGLAHTPMPPVVNQAHMLELHVEQKWVGWLLGSGGKTIKQIEAETGSKISIDQSSKDMGFSIVKVSGTYAGVQAAHQRIQASLAHVAPGGTAAVATDQVSALENMLGQNSGGNQVAAVAAPVPSGTPDGDMQIEQKWVGWLLGKSGTVLKEIETQSGCMIRIDQSTKEMGFSTVRIIGDWQQNALAKQLVTDKIAQAHPGGPRP